MCPLKIEAYSGDKSKWVDVGEVKPGEQPGSLSQNRPDGTREVILFSCASDNSQSTIYRSKSGIDLVVGNIRAIVNDMENWETVKVLKDGDPPHIMSLKTDVSPQRRIIRFTHYK